MSALSEQAPLNSPLITEIVDGIARLTLNRPARFNALDLALASELHRAVERIAERDDIHAVVLSGAGAAFCGGGDVVEMAAATDRAAHLRLLVDEMNGAIAALVELPVVVISLVQGVVAGGGLGLMLTGDVVLAERGTRFVSAYDGIGVTPDCGATVLLPAAVGVQRALDLTLTGRAVTAEEALSWGLVTELVAPRGLAGRASSLLDRMSRAPGAVGRTRSLIRRAAFPDLRARLAAEKESIAELAGGEHAGALIDKFTRGERGSGE